jgi:hypothetical protein
LMCSGSSSSISLQPELWHSSAPAQHADACLCRPQ